MYYAIHNTHADLANGYTGFSNTWEISRFETKVDRDAFVEKMENKNAKAVTRKQAIEYFNATYLSVGKEVPVGGLFGQPAFGGSYFWNE